MPPQESSQKPPEPTTRLEPPMMNAEPSVAAPSSPEKTREQSVIPPQPTTQIKPPIMPSIKPPIMPPAAASVMPPPPPPPTSTPSSSAKTPLFWSLVGVIATIVAIGIGFYLYGMFLNRSTTAPAPEAAAPVVRECGNDASCLASAVTACTPARGTVSVEDALSFVVARSVFDIVVTGAKNDLSCGVLITQNSASAALPDTFFEAAKILAEERGAVIEQFAKNNAEPNALLDALTGQDAACSFSSVGANALGTFLTRFREIEYGTSVDAATATATPVTVTKIGGVSVDVDFWRECSGTLAVNRPKALQDAAPLIKVK